MSIHKFWKPHDGSFGPETTRAMGEAFDAACAMCGNLSHNDREAIAERIIGKAIGGECDPLRLRNAGLAALRPHTAGTN